MYPMCQIPGSGSELPGLAGLGSLLLAMYVGGPATRGLGPLVVSHTAGGMFRGIVLTAGEAQTLDSEDPQLSADTLRQATGRAA
jgi:hypothetical protein